MDEPRNMGLGRLAAPTLQFVQRFRWTLESEGLDHTLVNKAKVHFRAKIIEFECFEFVMKGEERKVEVQDWSEEDIGKKDLILTTYDGMGNEIYRYVFSNLKFGGESTEYDYSESGPVLRKFQVKYKNYKRTVFQEDCSINPKEDADETGREGGDCLDGQEATERKCL